MKVCNKCNRELPEEAFYSKRRTNTCYECFKKKQREYERNRKARIQEMKIDLARKEYEKKKREEKKKEEALTTCKKDCLRYPCFRGIDNLKTNFALTCVKFNKR